MSDVIIKFQNVSKDYFVYKSNIKRMLGIIFGRGHSEIKHALKDVSFEIQKGERVAILGAVDSGCTTTMKIISGITFPSKGKVKIAGKVKEFFSPSAGLDMEFTSRDNIYLKANTYGLSRKEIDEHMDDIISFANLQDYMNIPFKQAPKSAPVRMALSVFDAVKADIMVLDNGMGAGGMRSRIDCENRVRHMLRDNPDMTFVLSSNIVKFAQAVCKRGIILDKGELVFDGPIEEAVKFMTELNAQGQAAEAATDKPENNDDSSDQSASEEDNNSDL